MAFVLDASIAVRWFILSQQTPYSLFVMSRLASEEMHVPSVWPFEVASVLLKEQNKGTISDRDIDRFLELLGKGALSVASSQSDIQSLLQDARQFRLTPPDSSYVRLALDFGLPIATADIGMQEAAVRVGVPLLLPPSL
jgi:predicted nucleic acid-binding protein